MNNPTDTGRALLQFGIVLFLLGLLTGFTLPLMENPRVGLSSHLEGVINGILLLVLGLLWSRLDLARGAERVLVAFAVYGTYANWFITMLAGFWGAGESMMPLAAAGYTGTTVQEGLIALALISLSLSMIVVSALVLWGLRRAGRADRPAT